MLREEEQEEERSGGGATPHAANAHKELKGEAARKLSGRPCTKSLTQRGGGGKKGRKAQLARRLRSLLHVRRSSHTPPDERGDVTVCRLRDERRRRRRRRRRHRLRGEMDGGKGGCTTTHVLTYVRTYYEQREEERQ